MSDGNGSLTDDQLDQLATTLRGDEQRSALNRESFATPGINLFPGDWTMDLTIPDCPDRPIGPHDGLDATLVYGRFENQHGRIRLREGTNRWPTYLRKRFIDQKTLRESLPARLREGYDSFEFGGGMGGTYGWGANSEYIPLLPGPATRQLYWQDYFAMSAKAFEAYNHDPLTWRCVQAMQEFVLGKGLEATVTKTGGTSEGQRHDQAQTVWDEFWTRNRMPDRLDTMCRDSSVLGELFVRYFLAGPGKLTIRSLDPASIYDLITDPEDVESVYAYHQQFQTPYQLYAPRGGQPATGVPPTGSSNGALTKFVVRQIPAPEIDHYRLNTSTSERRGRSDLFPALTWIQRMRHYLTAKVVREDMISRIAWDLTVDGNQGDITAVRQSIFPNNAPPAPGSILGHSPSVTLAPMEPGTVGQGSQVDPTFVALVNMVCASIGVPVDYVVQIMRGGTRANALVATEPAAKRFEKRQAWFEGILHDMFDRVMVAANITDAQLEVTFPPIASEDTTQLLKDLSYAESNQYLSKKTAATMAAKALDISTYDFETEQSLIADEFPEPEMEDDPDGIPNPITGKPAQKAKQGDGVLRRTMISIDNRQTAKLDPTKSPSEEDQPPGMLVPYTGVAPGPGGGAPGGPPQAPVTRGGMPAAQNPASAAGANSIKRDNNTPTREVLDALEHLTEEVRMLRETRQPRKRPDDPDFKAAAEEYRRQTAEHLKALVRDGS